MLQRVGFIRILKETNLSYMHRALEVSKRAIGTCNPNPPVGAVIVKDGSIVGEGYTSPPGGMHAEKNAIRQAGKDSDGASLYVTLEPCSHYGRTPPCTLEIIDAGIKEVHIGIKDPDTRVNGKGIEELKRNGLSVYVGDMSQECRTSMEAHVKLMETGIPFVTAKFAASLDGKIATSSGESQWITGEDARDCAHKIRSRNDAIMVGIGTVIADDPRLTVRGNDFGEDIRQPIRIVIDSKGRIPSSSTLLYEKGDTIVLTGDNQIVRDFPSSVSLKGFPGMDNRVDLSQTLKYLGTIPISSILVEGGAELLGSLFDCKLVDKVEAFLSPTIIGGIESKSAVLGNGASVMSEIVRLSNVEVSNIGDDVQISGYCINLS